MVLFRNREKFQGFSAKIGDVFSKFGLSPNQWTIVSLIIVFFSVYFLIKENFLVAGVLFIVASFTDLIDGSVARKTGKVSKLGAYLDTIVDRYVEGLIIFGLLFASLPDLAAYGFTAPLHALVFLYLFGSMMTTYAKAAAKEAFDKVVKGGILERAERLLILFAGIILAFFNPIYLTWTIGLLAVLTNISALQRIAIACRKPDKISNIV